MRSPGLTFLLVIRTGIQPTIQNENNFSAGQVFEAAAVAGSEDFDTLLDRVLASLPETWITHAIPSTSRFARSN
jgi:hypothetical protein